MSAEIVFYEIGKQKGHKEATINADASSITYDSETKTVTMTVEGGDSE